jgi:outer membrane protein W
VLIIFFFNCYAAHSQKKYSAQVGIGLGHTLNKDYKNRNKLQLGGYYNFNKRFSAGLELSATGNLIYPVINDEIADRVTNIVTLNPSINNSTVFLSKLRYYFTDKEKSFKPFVELGAGINTYSRKIFNIPALTSQKIRRSNFAFQPEVGFSFKHFQFSAAYLLGGKTPGFTGVNDRGEVIKMQTVTLNTLYFTAGWRFDF